MKIAVFTRTLWSEMPRIRHQLTKLLIEHGHEIVFFEKSYITPWSRSVTKENPQLTLVRSGELCHHQLKFNKFLQYLYKYVSKLHIIKYPELIDVDFIVNFNYDYDFLRDVFPNKKIITIIHDDFVAQAKSWMKKPIANQISNTCKRSDAVLAVSYPILEQVNICQENSFLFLPWCQNTYRAPARSKIRDVVLFVGYINNRIDWKVVDYLLSQSIKLRFVGPIRADREKKIIELYKKNQYFEYVSETPFDELTIDDVCCSIIPYDRNMESVQACTVNNKVFQILSVGIPVIYPKLPYLFETDPDIIYQAISFDDWKDKIIYFQSNFYRVQNKIKNFLPEHYPEKRYEQFLKICNF